MKRFFTILAATGLTIVSLNSCAALQLGLAATELALSTASLVGHSVLLGHDLHTFVGSHKTAYEFEIVDVKNDGGIPTGEIVYPKADNQYKAEYRDGLVDFTFCYSLNCFRLGLKNCTNSYLAINWNDVVMDSSSKLLWKDASSSLSTITPAAFNEAYLYVVYDTVSATYRTLPLYTSQKKADSDKLVGESFTLTFPIIKGEKVITYTATIKIASVTVN